MLLMELSIISNGFPLSWVSIFNSYDMIKGIN